MFAGAGMWALLVAVAWWTKESHSSGWVGVTTFAAMLPFLVVSPIAGLLADRLNRRNLAAICFVGEAAVAATLATLLYTGAVEVWHVAVLAFVAGSFRSTSEPSVQALIPNQVPAHHLLNAITLYAMTRHGARFFGLLVASPLLAVDAVGVRGVLVFSAALYACAAFFMMRGLTISRGDARPQQSAVQGMMEGLKYIYSNQTIAVFILLVAFHCALVMSYDSVTPVFSQEQLGATDGSFLGYLVMGFGAGSLIGTLLVAGVRTERLKGQLMVWTGLASGIAPILLALMGNIVPAVFFAAAMGAAQATFMAITNAYVLSISPDRLRGRIASLYVLHAGGIMAFANLGYGFLADTVNAPVIFFATSTVFLAVLLSLVLAQPILRRVYRTGEVAAA
jgi:MFS family permease